MVIICKNGLINGFLALGSNRKLFSAWGKKFDQQAVDNTRSRFTVWNHNWNANFACGYSLINKSTYKGNIIRSPWPCTFQSVIGLNREVTFIFPRRTMKAVPCRGRISSLSRARFPWLVKTKSQLAPHVVKWLVYSARELCHLHADWGTIWHCADFNGNFISQ